KTLALLCLRRERPRRRRAAEQRDELAAFHVEQSPRSRVGLRATPARQIFRLFASRQAQRPLRRGGKIPFDRLPFDLAAEKIRPQKLTERGGVLGKTARSPKLAGQAAERIVLQLHDGLRDVGKISATALRVEGVNQALVIEHGPKG